MKRETNDSEQLETPLREAVAATLPVAMHQDAIERVKTKARQIPRGSLTPQRLYPEADKGRIRRFAGSLVIAAVLMIAVTGMLLIYDSGSRAFAQVIQNVNAATSLRVDMISRIGRSAENRGQLLANGDHVRTEQFDGRVVSILAAKSNQVLFLDQQNLVAQLSDMNEGIANRFTNPIRELQQAKSADAKDIGEEVLNGRRTRVYRLSKVDTLGIQGDAEMTIWVDSESQLPAKIVIRDTDPKNRMEVRFENFQWNPKLGDELFALQIPDGFKTGIVVTSTPAKAQEREGKTTLSTFADSGILSHDRVPSRIVWNAENTVTALMRDPESLPAHQQGAHELRQWDLSTGKLRWTQPVRGAGCLAVSADGKSLATVIGDEIQVRDASSGVVTHAWDAKISIITLAFSPDGQTLAGGVAEWQRGESELGGVRFWDIQTGTLIRETDSDAFVTRFITYSHDGKYLAAASNRSVKLFDASTGDLVRVVPGSSRVAVAPNSQTIACVGASADKAVSTVDIYDVSAGTLVRTLTSDAGQDRSWLLSVQYSTDGEWVAAADWNQSVTLWNVETGQRHSIGGHSGGVHAIAFAPRGGQIATGGEDRRLRIQKVPTK